MDGLVSDEFVEQNPVVSRTIKIQDNQTLETLHDALFDAFDREDEHLYEFVFGTGPRDPNAVKHLHPMMFDDAMPSNMTDAGDVTETKIGSLELEVGQTFFYMFDYGDGWWHQIKVLTTDEEAPKGRYPKVTERVGESPPQYDYPDEDDGED